MRNLADTITRLAAARRLRPSAASQGLNDRLTDLADFGSNPGALRARSYIPAGLGKSAPLVVVLHGCTQSAAGYDHGSGWSQLAEQDGFALLYPEQQRANNPNLCFNWFVPEDSRRGSGEALSIRQMIETMFESHDLDPSRVFVTGLSAGGAMASIMLATYPEVFTGGAIIAGLPFGCAATIPEAFDRMRGHGLPTPAAATALVRGASAHEGPWPTISVWHGTRDQTVANANADAIIAQWRGIHAVPAKPSHEESVDGQNRRTWCDAKGTARIEAFSIPNMGHGTPLDAGDDIHAPGPFLLDAGISSTRHIARFWGVSKGTRVTAAGKKAIRLPAPASTAARTTARTTATTPAAAATPRATQGVGKIIEDALRSAGLMR